MHTENKVEHTETGVGREGGERTGCTRLGLLSGLTGSTGQSVLFFH